MPKPIRVALATRCLNQPLKPALLWASQMGAGGVQLDARNELAPASLGDTGRRQILHRLEELDLSVASLDFPLRRPLWDASRLDERIDALKQAMQFAYQLKARVVTVRLGGLPGESDLENLALLRAVLDDVARHANRVGVTVALGPGPEPVSRLLDVLREIKEGPVGVNFDPAALVTTGSEPAKTLRDLAEFVTHVMIRDATRDATGITNEVPVGRGEVPWDEMLALLAEMEYGGWLTVDRTQGDDRAGDAARAIQFLRSIYLG